HELRDDSGDVQVWCDADSGHGTRSSETVSRLSPARGCTADHPGWTTLVAESDCRAPWTAANGRSTANGRRLSSPAVRSQPGERERAFGRIAPRSFDQRSSDSTFCGTAFACESIAMPACCRTWARERFAVSA